MSLFVEGEWTRPFENYTLDTLRENQKYAKGADLLLREYFGAALPDSTARELMLPDLNEDDERIYFDWAYLHPDDKTRDPSGVHIFYPAREPETDEIENRTFGADSYTAIKGFGYLFVQFDAPKPYQLEKLAGETVSPLRLDLRVKKKIFHSFPHVDYDSTDQQHFIAYRSWQPMNGTLEGIIYIPTDLPTLVGLEFRLTRMDPMRAFRYITPNPRQ